jgi:hypothetical protein
VAYQPEDRAAAQVISIAIDPVTGKARVQAHDERRSPTRGPTPTPTPPADRGVTR